MLLAGASLSLDDVYMQKKKVLENCGLLCGIGAVILTEAYWLYPAAKMQSILFWCSVTLSEKRRLW